MKVITNRDLRAADTKNSLKRITDVFLNSVCYIKREETLKSDILRTWIILKIWKFK